MTVTVVHLCLTLGPHGLESTEFCRTEHWSGQPFPSPGYLPNPGIKPRSPALQVDSLPADPQGKPRNTEVGSLSLLQRIFPTQESNQGLLHGRRFLYHLSYQGCPRISCNRHHFILTTNLIHFQILKHTSYSSVVSTAQTRNAPDPLLECSLSSGSGLGVSFPKTSGPKASRACAPLHWMGSWCWLATLHHHPGRRLVRAPTLRESHKPPDSPSGTEAETAAANSSEPPPPVRSQVSEPNVAQLFLSVAVT